MTEYLFSYGTLQNENVQLQSFGRILKGTNDALIGYTLSMVEITDPDVLAKSNQQFHPIAIRTGNEQDLTEGMVFEVTGDELLKADDYEVDAYHRVKGSMRSGKTAWAYVEV